MSRRDSYHYACKTALIRDGWTITHDPFPITYRGTAVSTDLGAEKESAIEGLRIAVELIAVEVKDLDGQSVLSDFEKALGQFHLYRTLLKRREPERQIFLAVRKKIYDEFFQRPAIQEVVRDSEISMIVFDEDKEEVVQWIK